MAEKTGFREPGTRQRKRKVCSKCGQNLSHAAYIRHQNPTVCPGKVDPKRKCERTGSMPNDGECSEFQSECEERQEKVESIITNMDWGQNGESESEESEGDTVEIVSDGEGVGDTAVDSTTEELHPAEGLGSNMDKQPLPSNQEQLRVVAAHICLFISFFSFVTEFLNEE